MGEGEDVPAAKMDLASTPSRDELLGKRIDCLSSLGMVLES